MPAGGSPCVRRSRERRSPSETGTVLPPEPQLVDSLSFRRSRIHTIEPRTINRTPKPIQKSWSQCPGPGASNNGPIPIKRNLPGGEGSLLARDLANVESAYTSIVEGERELMREYTLLIDSASKTREALDSSNPSDAGASPTLVYWQDESGEHAFVTERPLIS